MRVGLRIVADENIVLADEYFSPFGQVIFVNGYTLGPNDLQDADVLLVRSVTKVDGSLLSGAADIRFVGSATTGTDHVDQTFLDSRGVPFAHAPGTNAESVVEYVLSAVASMYPSIDGLRGLTVGVVGLGTIGSRVARRLACLGSAVQANDPPLVEEGRTDEQGVPFVDLDRLLETSDIVTLHVSLISGGPWPTRDLITKEKAGRLKSGALFINTSRGEITTSASLQHMASRDIRLALDVWPCEPEPDVTLVKRAEIATPHIAGYSYDGKVAGTRAIRDAMVRALGLEHPTDTNFAGERPLLDIKRRQDATSIIRAMYDVSVDTRRFKEAYIHAGKSERGRVFAEQRRDYPVRRSFRAYVGETRALDHLSPEVAAGVTGRGQGIED